MHRDPISRALPDGWAHRAGATLIELMVVVAIVGILAAVAIPAFSSYRFEASLSEAFTNVQGIIEAEQAYYSRFQRYSPSLADQGPCPRDPVPAGLDKQLFIPSDCVGNWVELGWMPDGPVAFQYNFYTSYDENGVLAYLPGTTDAPNMDSGVPWGVDWAVEFGTDVTRIQPWVAVEAFGDIDKNGIQVFIRTNSFNYTAFRSPEVEF